MTAVYALPPPGSATWHYPLLDDDFDEGGDEYVGALLGAMRDRGIEVGIDVLPSFINLGGSHPSPTNDRALQQRAARRAAEALAESTPDSAPARIISPYLLSYAHIDETDAVLMSRLKALAQKRDMSFAYVADAIVKASFAWDDTIENVLQTAEIATAKLEAAKLEEEKRWQAKV